MMRTPRTLEVLSGSAFAALALSLIVTTSAAQDTAPVVAHEQMVVAANPHAAQAGIDILRAGGSAVDAAIAIQLVLSLVEPQSSSIGGGAFMLYLGAPEDGGQAELTAYSGRETAPLAATPDLFLDAQGKPRGFADVGWGGLAVGVPGVMRMLERAHDEHGRLPWSQLFNPAIQLAEDGFEITPRLYFLLDRFKSAAMAEAFREHFYDADGEAWPTGHRLANPEYAATLRLLAAKGADAMYTGPLAEAIVLAVHDNNIEPGLLALDDLARYQAEESAPLCSPYRQWTVCGPPLPSSGGITVQQILGIASSFDLSTADNVRRIHVIAEASRLAFADRNLYLGDPAFVSVPVAELLRPAYLRERAGLISLDSTMGKVSPGSPSQLAAWNYSPSGPNELKSTSHFSVTDKWGNAVSMTTSVQSTFGSQLMVGGFILNNQLTDFSYEPERDGRPIANRPDGGKHPLSSMAPTFVLDNGGRLHMIVGSPGGTRIIGFVAQAVVGVLDFGLNAQEAVAAPHFLSQYGPIELEEDSAALDYAAGLEALGHQVRERNMNSGLHAIVIEYTDGGRVLYGGVDPRREGLAVGD